MLCASFAQLYYSDAPYGILTGLMAGDQGIVDFGFSPSEVAESRRCIEKLARGKLVSKVRKPIILDVLVLPPVSFLDLGPKHLTISPDSDVLTEQD